MSDYKSTARIVGALFLISYLGLILGGIVLGPVLDAPDYLGEFAPHESRVRLAVLLELVNPAAIVGIAVLLFPLFRRSSEGLALGYVGFRILEAVLSILFSISLLPLIDLSREYIQAGAPDAPAFQMLGAWALSQRAWASETLTVFFILGALALYVLLYQTRLVPRFIAIWGLVAVALLIIANLMNIPDPTEGFHAAQLLLLPIILNEFFLAIWLLVKGFNPSAIVFQPA